MLIIPVIDVMGGRVVHAQGGNRAAYPPLRSQVCTGSDPESVIAELMDWFPFTVIYIADLDAIETGQYNLPLYQQLSERFPQLTLWLDAGIRQQDDWKIWQSFPQIKPVIGSESLQDIHLLSQLGQSDALLSLDFRQGKLVGQHDLLRMVDSWPQQIIVMSLHAIGANQGPDNALLKLVRSLKPDAAVFAAGGVRGEKDLLEMAAAGISGALIASALHNGKLRVETLRQLNK